MESNGNARTVTFGTDGWRAIIAKDFTFDNVARVAQAFADHIRSDERKNDPIYTDWGSEYRSADQGIVVGYDTRFLSREFALHFARVIQENGIPVHVGQGFVPTPALSYAVVDRQAAAGIMFTSSHNPPQYNGIKIKAEYGGSAPKSITASVESRLPAEVPVLAHSESPVPGVDLKTPYIQRMHELIDTARLTASPVQVVVDSMYGSAQGYVAGILDHLSIPYVQIRGTRDVMFGGKSPEPLERNLAPLRGVIGSTVKRTSRRTIGVVTDGDGDRISAMDEKGAFIDAHRTYALILRYLVEKRGWRGPVVASFNLSDLVRRMCDAYSLEVIEIPIGFKHAAEHILKRDILMAGEEIGSIAIRGHIPERDGVLFSLLLVEILASSRKTASGLVKDLHITFGPQVYHRRDLHVEALLEIVERLLESPPDKFAGHTVRSVETLDGIKLRFDKGWLLFRASGTEPILRVYCEMTTERDVERILNTAEKLARGDITAW